MVITTDYFDRFIHDNGLQYVINADLSDEEQKVVAVLQGNNDLHLNMLAVQADIPVNRLTGVLFELEMKGIVRTHAGGMYHLLK